MKKIIILLVVINLIYFATTCLADDNSTMRDPFQKSQNLSDTIHNDEQGNLSFDFSDVPIRDILQALAQYANKNIVISDEVKGNITLHLQHVTWRQALTTILLMANLNMREQDNVLLISNQTNNMLINATNSSQLFKIRYAKAADLVTIIKNSGNNLLSANGNISADPRTNSLWVYDTPEKLNAIRNLVQRLDIPVKQVSIKARIVNVDDNCLQELGVKFGTVNTDDVLSLDGLGMDMPVSVNQNGKFNIAIARLGPNTLLDLELSALESEGHGRIISSPELITADRQAAYIEAGEEVPYQEKTSSGATNVAFKKAVLSLKVVPQITAENHIVLDLTVNQDKVSAVTVNGVPAIQTREVQTQVAVQNNQTLVLGGIYEQSEGDKVERIPFLGSLPMVGGLFRNKVVQSERKELLIFVTPRVVN